MNPKQILGERICVARKEAGLRQYELARAIGVTDPTVNRWERGHNAPRLEQRRALAQILGRPVEFFEEPVASSEDHAVQTLARVLLDALHGAKRENTAKYVDRRQVDIDVSDERRQRAFA